MAVYGGHDCSFVDEVSDRFHCSICTKILRDPHLAVCCGQHFCESCLDQWFTRQGKESCPHCRAEEEAFKHVIHKGLRSEINELKIRCSNHGGGCQWTGELGALKKHLESDNGCGYVMVECPNKCKVWHRSGDRTSVMSRRSLADHLTQSCYLRPYQCKFCGHKDSYEAITGDGYTGGYARVGDDYYGHQAECPEVPLTCPNNCGSNKIKRKDLVNHRRQCPREPVECPFVEAGCEVCIYRNQLENHMSASLQEHLMLIAIDRKHLKTELYEVKAKLSEVEAKLDETKCKLFEAETFNGSGADFSFSVNQLKKEGDSLKLTMQWFSEYRRSGKVWHSPPFYYREGYKMCLAVYANGVGKGAGTHISVTVIHLKGEYDDQLEWPMKTCGIHFSSVNQLEGYYQFLVCCALQRQQVNECKH